MLFKYIILLFADITSNKYYLIIDNIHEREKRYETVKKNGIDPYVHRHHAWHDGLRKQ